MELCVGVSIVLLPEKEGVDSCRGSGKDSANGAEAGRGITASFGLVLKTKGVVAGRGSGDTFCRGKIQPERRRQEQQNASSLKRSFIVYLHRD